jgi:hypothetical protein
MKAGCRRHVSKASPRRGKANNIGETKMIIANLTRRRATTFLGTAFALALLSGCAPTKVAAVQPYQGAQLPRPNVVVITDFLASPDTVKVDSGIGARLRNRLSGTSQSTEQTEDDRKITAKISEILVAEINKLGLPAIRGNDPSLWQGAAKVVVGGEILSVDEGNRTRRNVIGLGAGKSDIQARADIYYSSGFGEPRFIESFAADAQSSRKPGAAETMGVGAATGRAAESGAVGVATGVTMSGDVEGDSERMAKAMAEQLTAFFAKQGWIPPRG